MRYRNASPILSTAIASIVATTHAPSSIAQIPQILEEVIVTAQKREQTLQDTPIAVSVTSSETIQQAQIHDLNDLQILVPSLRVETLQAANQTNFKIRGFGNGANAIGVEPSTGVFIDGVYRSRSSSAIQDLPNVERIEVLRGPQSTLYGKNASAGVISVTSKKPSFEGEGSIEATFGNYDTQNFKGYWSGPLTDELAFSISGSYSERDGYIDNLAADDFGLPEEVNDRDRWRAQADLLWEPIDTLSIRVLADYSEIDEQCCGAPAEELGPTAAAIFAVGGQINDGDPFDYEIYLNTDLRNDIEDQGISATIEWDLENFTFTSITAYRENDVSRLGDTDFNSSDVIAPTSSPTDIETFTQEMRLTSAGDGNFDWMVGFFYFDESVWAVDDSPWGSAARPYFDLLLGPDTLALIESIYGLPIGTAYEEGRRINNPFGQDNEAYSIFGQLDWHVTDALTLTAGLNYTEDEKEAFSKEIENSNIYDALELRGTPFEPLRGLQIYPPQLEFPNEVEDGETTDDEITWTLRAAWDVNDEINVYISAATGFKATSWNLTPNSRPFESDRAAIEAAGIATPNLSYGGRYADPENSTVYELGMKARWSAVTMNLAVFDQTIDDFQTNLFTGTGFAFANAEEQSVQGAELEMSWYPLDSLALNLAVTYLDAEYDEFTGSSLGDLSGTTPGGIPEYAGNISAIYSHTFSNGWDSFIRGDYIYEDEHAISDDLPDIEREVGMFNASAGITTADGWGAQIWVKNLNEDEYLIRGFPGPGQTGTVYSYPNMPRTYGITLRKDFF